LSEQDRFCVLVVSCDNYSDLWVPFFKLFWRFWGDCPFRVYLLVNEKEISIPNVHVIRVGKDISWSDNLISALTYVNEHYILMVLDDLFFIDYVSNQNILRVVDWILQHEPNYVRMKPSPKPDKPYNGIVGIVSKGTIYRTSTVMSVWKKEILIDLLKPGETAWEFEIYGTVRSDKYDGFYSTWEDLFPVVNGVIKGKWQRNVVKKLQSLDVEININGRKVMSGSETSMFWFKKQRSRFLNLMPSKYRRKIKEIVLGDKYTCKISE